MGTSGGSTPAPTPVTTITPVTQTINSSTYNVTDNLVAENANILSLQIPTNSAAGLALTSDGNGVATWQPSTAVTGPVTSTQYSIPVFSSSTGNALQASSATISPSGVLSVSSFQFTETPSTGATLTSDFAGNTNWGSTPIYGTAIGEDTSTTAAGGLIIFDIGGVIFPNSGFTSVPAAGGASFTVLTAGRYEFDFYVSANSGAGLTEVLELAIDINGTTSAQQTFRSCLGTSNGADMICTGTGYIDLHTSDVVSLRNVTNSSTTAIHYTNIPVNGVAGTNRSFTLQQFAPPPCLIQ